MPCKTSEDDGRPAAVTADQKPYRRVEARDEGAEHEARRHRSCPANSIRVNRGVTRIAPTLYHQHPEEHAERAQDRLTDQHSRRISPGKPRSWRRRTDRSDGQPSNAAYAARWPGCPACSRRWRWYQHQTASRTGCSSAGGQRVVGVDQEAPTRWPIPSGRRGDAVLVTTSTTVSWRVARLRGLLVLLGVGRTCCLCWLNIAPGTRGRRRTGKPVWLSLDHAAHNRVTTLSPQAPSG